MPRPTILEVVLVAISVAGCSVVGTGSPSADAPTEVSSSSEPSRSAGDRKPLPDGFPVMLGAVSVPLPRNDPGLIARWESDKVGSAAYDFYVVALPAAGYPFVGLYPGGEVAVIRFRSPEGKVWQMVVHGAPDGRVAIEIRLDRP